MKVAAIGFRQNLRLACLQDASIGIEVINVIVRR